MVPEPYRFFLSPSLMAHSAGFVTTQSIAFKYVMASEPCSTVTPERDLIFKDFLSLKHLYVAVKVKCF
jgi:hypothetical protein